MQQNPNRIFGEFTTAKDAYQIAKEQNPAVGTREEWLESLHGATGPIGPVGPSAEAGATGATGSYETLSNANVNSAIEADAAATRDSLELGSAALADTTDFAPALGTDDNYVTDAEKTILGNTSGTNTGDQDLSGYALTSSLAEVATSGDYADLDNLPTLGSAAAANTTDFAPALGADDNYVTDAEKTVLGNTSGTNTGDQDLSGYALSSSLAEVATSGDYDDLSNLPTLGTAAAEDVEAFAPALGADDNYVTDAEKTVIGNTSGTNTGDQDLSGYVLTEELADVATSGDYNDLSNLPTLGTAAAEDVEAFATAAQGDLADTSLQPVAVDYRGEYNNGDGTYAVGSVVLYEDLLYIKISNPGNPGYPPYGADWELFEPLIGSPAYDLWVQTSFAALPDTYLQLAGGVMDVYAAIGWANGSAIREAGDQGLEIECSVGYRWQWVAGRMILRMVNSGQIARIIAIDGIAPTVTDDITAGFVPDTRWEMADGMVYLCTDSTEGAAVWIEAPVDHIQFDTTGGTLDALGQVAWDADEETLAVVLKNDTILQVGEETLYHVENVTGSTIDKGTPVMYAGTTGNSGKLRVKPWDGTLPKAFLGIATSDIPDTETGYVTHFGKAKGFQTNGANYGQTWASGEIIYAVSGSSDLTNVEPTEGGYVIVAVVIAAHASNGTLFVRPNQVPTASEVGALPLAGGTMDAGADINFANGSRLREGLTDAGNGGAGGIAMVCSLDYEFKWEAGRLYVMGQDGFTIRVEMFGFTAVPTATDDGTKGYIVGSRRILDDGAVYICTDATEDDAVWASATVYAGGFSGGTVESPTAAYLPQGFDAGTLDSQCGQLYAGGYYGGTIASSSAAEFPSGLRVGNIDDIYTIAAIDVTNRYLYDSSGVVSVEWGGLRNLKDTTGYNALDWGLRQLIGPNGVDVAVDWSDAQTVVFLNGISLGGSGVVFSGNNYYDGATIGISGLTVIDVSNRRLISPTNSIMLDWSDPDGFGIINVNGNHFMNVDNLADASDVPSLYVNSRLAVDSAGTTSFDWNSRQLLASDGTTVIADWGAGVFGGFVIPTLEVGSVFGSGGSMVSIGSNGDSPMATSGIYQTVSSLAVDITNRQLIGNDGTTVMMDWNSDYLISTSRYLSAQGVAGLLLDSDSVLTAMISVDPNNRQLLASDGTTVVAEWGNAGYANKLTTPSLISNLDLNDGTLGDGAGAAVDWVDHKLINTSYISGTQGDSLNWNTRQLIANDGTTTVVDWSDPSYLNIYADVYASAFAGEGNTNGLSSAATFPNGLLCDYMAGLSGGDVTFQYGISLNAIGGSATGLDVNTTPITGVYSIRNTTDQEFINGDARGLYDGAGVTSVEWGSRQLIGTDGTTVMAQWSNSSYFETNLIYGINGSIGVDLASGDLENGYTAALNWIYRTLNDASGNPVAKWGEDFGTGNQGIAFGPDGMGSFYNLLNSQGINFPGGSQYNGSTIVYSSATAIDVANRQLIGSDGTTVALDWSQGGYLNSDLFFYTSSYIDANSGFVSNLGAATFPYGATLTPTAVASLVGGEGTISYVNDADTPVIGSAVVGGGSAKCLVCYNGTDHIVTALL